MDKLIEKFRKVILLNEGLPGDPDYWLRFTDPDGVRSGKSGYSFGVVQFDIQNNQMAITCLKDCGFTDKEISDLKTQVVGLDLAPLELKLRAHASIIKEYDERQLIGCIIRAKKMGVLIPHDAADDTALLCLADYDNQYGLTFIQRPPYIMYYLATLQRNFTSEDILSYKLDHTKYGREHPGDCHRRYDNLIQVMNEKDNG